jgi:hypothetical protein
LLIVVFGGTAEFRRLTDGNFFVPLVEAVAWNFLGA